MLAFSTRDLNERTRAFTQRLLRDQNPAAYPGMGHAGCYAGTLLITSRLSPRSARRKRRRTGLPWSPR